ncbi:MAG TPA: polyprenyl synthetase family protein [Chthoniobacterales bacterium]|jgi:geranylgeranyl pyrophosphate synthase/predicted secreted hydrolase|nr:polyprenyl synthetase family protein [Chthoniobacterales bacterium]
MELRNETAIGLADESPKTDFPIEWWFVQGRFESATLGSSRFMVSVFRHALEWAGISAGNAYSLLISVLDEASGKTSWLSQVDPATIPFLATALRMAPPAGLDPIAVRALTDEISEYGLPKNIRALGGAHIEGGPLRAHWGDFALQQTETGLELSFAEPTTNRRCAFQLRPLRPRFHLADVAVANGGSMDYVSYTRLALEGSVDGEAVQGEAWLDHQWGSQGWFVDGQRTEQIFGWDWLGIQFENGGDLLVMVIRDQRSGVALCQYGVAVDENGTSRLLRDVTIEPRAWWTSPLSNARYPVSCRIAIPSIDLSIDFEPLAVDQEIPVFPPLRAVWEGAGTVAGSQQGAAVRGSARLELHGYAYVLDLEEHLEQSIDRIRADIATFLPRSFSQHDLERMAGPAQSEYDLAAQTDVLAKPLWDFMDRGGGNPWRPIFPMLILAALGTEPAPFSSLISITAEMLHDGLLMIDDILDNSDCRRGQESIHRRYGLDVAINAGNTAYFLPMVLLRDHPHLSDEQRLELFRILTRLYVRVHLGQGQDIHWSKSLTRDKLDLWMNDGVEDKIIQLYNLKTASVVEAGADGACVIAKVDEATRHACREFGRSFGLAFQIVNDLAEFNPNVIARGTESSDIAAGKLSYVIAKALRLLPPPEATRLKEILCSPALRAKGLAVAEGIDLVQRSGALAKCREEAQHLMEEKWKEFSAHVPPSEPKTMLRVLWNFLLSLDRDERYARFAPGN